MQQIGCWAKRGVFLLAAMLVAQPALAQQGTYNNTGTIVVTAPLRDLLDVVVRSFWAKALGNYVVMNRAGGDGVVAAREMQGKATDGSELMVVFVNETLAAEGKMPSASYYSHLEPVALLGEVETKYKTWFGLFAPPGTPDPVVQALNARVRQAMRVVKAPDISGISFAYAADPSPSALRQRMSGVPMSRAPADDPKGVGGGASPD
jgi:tripartite-type tricarboxylate transporter receptor subunit TctC